MVAVNGNIRFPILCGHCYGDISPTDEKCIWCGKILGVIEEEEIEAIEKEEIKAEIREIFAMPPPRGRQIIRGTASEIVGVVCAMCGKTLTPPEVLTHWCKEYDRAVKSGEVKIYDGPTKKPIEMTIPRKVCYFCGRWYSEDERSEHTSCGTTVPPSYGGKCSRCGDSITEWPISHHECKDLIEKNPEYKKSIEKFSMTKLLKRKRISKNGVDETARNK